MIKRKQIDVDLTGKLDYEFDDIIDFPLLFDICEIFHTREDSLELFSGLIEDYLAELNYD